MEPILKWAGGKRKLLPVLNSIIAELDFNPNTGCYYEPFIGGGALCFEHAFPKACINDINTELINVYMQVKNNPNALISELEIHAQRHCEDYYQEIRSLDKNNEFEKIGRIKRAARIIYLNKTCYNGLYRVNKRGYYNTPMGKYKNPKIVERERIQELSNYFRNNSITILNTDFVNAVSDAHPGDLIYFDPPYDYDNKGFIEYTAAGFGHNQLKELKAISDELIEKRCLVIISNNETKSIMNLFEGDNKYKIKRILNSRSICCQGEKRNKAKEVIIYNSTSRFLKIKKNF